MTPGPCTLSISRHAAPAASAHLAVTAGCSRGRFVAFVPGPDGRGYWLAQAGGGVYPYGDTRFLGAAGAGLGPEPFSAVSAIAAVPGPATSVGYVVALECNDVVVAFTPAGVQAISGPGTGGSTVAPLIGLTPAATGTSSVVRFAARSPDHPHRIHLGYCLHSGALRLLAPWW